MRSIIRPEKVLQVHISCCIITPQPSLLVTTKRLARPRSPPERQHQNSLYLLPPSFQPQSLHSAPSNYPPRPPTPHPSGSPLRSQSSSLPVRSRSLSPAHSG